MQYSREKAEEAKTPFVYAPFAPFRGRSFLPACFAPRPARRVDMRQLTCGGLDICGSYGENAAMISRN
jgi:hypothetical protein